MMMSLEEFAVQCGFWSTGSKLETSGLEVEWSSLKLLGQTVLVRHGQEGCKIWEAQELRQGGQSKVH